MENISFEDKLKNYRSLINGSLKFHNYLAYNANIDFSKTDSINKTIVSQCILMLSIYKDVFLKKKDLKVNSSGLDLLLQSLIDINCDKSEKTEYLNLIRNKLLHGEYYVENDEIIINGKNEPFKIKINELCTTCVSEYIALIALNEGKNYRTMVLSPNCDFKISDVYDLEEVMDNCKIIEFVDEPVVGKKRDDNYTCIVENFYESFSQIVFSSINDVEKYLNENLKIFDIFWKCNNINLSYTIKNVNETEYYDQIKKLYLDDNNIINGYTTHNNWIANMIYSLSSENRIFYASLMNNLIDLYKISGVYSITSSIHKNKAYTSYRDDQVIASGINLFYSTYQYGLDSVLKNEPSLKKIITNESFDFSKLNLSIANDNNMHKKNILTNIHNEYLAIEQEYELAKELCTVAVANYMNNRDKKLVKSLLKDIRDKELIVKEKEELYDLATKFIYNDFDKYITNFNIINHIRNSISHGNLIIKNQNCKSIDDRIIEITDKHNDDTTYHSVIKYSDFITLVSLSNIDFVKKYLQSYNIEENTTLLDKVKKLFK